MSPQNDSVSSFGLPQSDSDMGQLPPIHTPQTFHAPDAPLTHIDMASPTVPPVALTSAIPAPIQPDPIVTGPPGLPMTPPSADPTNLSQKTAALSAEAAQAVQADETDTEFDEEWANKAREIVQRFRSDPHAQSQAIGQLKADYIKRRYNKDIKVSG